MVNITRIESARHTIVHCAVGMRVVAGGGWRAAGGEWRVACGGGHAGNIVYLCGLFCVLCSHKKYIFIFTFLLDRWLVMWYYIYSK